MHPTNRLCSIEALFHCRRHRGSHTRVLVLRLAKNEALLAEKAELVAENAKLKSEVASLREALHQASQPPPQQRRQGSATGEASAANAARTTASPPVVPSDDMLLRQRLEEARMTLVGALQVRAVTKSSQTNMVCGETEALPRLRTAGPHR